jgi:hypothetical protein
MIQRGLFVGGGGRGGWIRLLWYDKHSLTHLCLPYYSSQVPKPVLSDCLVIFLN